MIIGESVDVFRSTLPKRFWEKVQIEKTDGCWEWQSTLVDGYGRFLLRRKNYLAHRLTYQAFRGEIPTDLVTDHLCRNRKCVNPYHLEITTFGENVRRGISPSAINLTKTHCPQGHPLTEDNLVKFLWERDGYRHCLICRRVSSLKYVRKRRAAKRIVED